LSPTKVGKVDIDEKNHKARVAVPEDQLSIAIGKSGQNVRLASKLTGYEIDISAEQDKSPVVSPDAPPADVKPKAAPKLKKKEQLESSLLEAIEEHGE